MSAQAKLWLDITNCLRGGGLGGHKMWFVDDLPLGKRLELSRAHTLRAQLHLHGVYIDLRARIVLVAAAVAIGDDLFLLMLIDLYA